MSAELCWLLCLCVLVWSCTADAHGCAHGSPDGGESLAVGWLVQGWWLLLLLLVVPVVEVVVVVVVLVVVG